MIEQMPRPNWEPLPRESGLGVFCRVLLNRSGIAIANLRFSPHSTIEEHSANFEIDVLCLKGEGFISVGKDVLPFRAGERVVWPAGIKHRLWTETDAMETLMVERNGHR